MKESPMEKVLEGIEFTVPLVHPAWFPTPHASHPIDPGQTEARQKRRERLWVVKDERKPLRRRYILMGTVAFLMEERMAVGNGVVKWQVTDVTTEAFEDFMKVANECADDSASIEHVKAAFEASMWVVQSLLPEPESENSASDDDLNDDVES